MATFTYRPSRWMMAVIVTAASLGVAHSLVSAPQAAVAFTRTQQEDQPLIVDVRIVGNQSVPTDQIRARLKTRQDRYYDPDLLHADTRELSSMGSFSAVRPYVQQVSNGIIVTFELVERPIISEVKFVGNRALTKRSLRKKSGLEAGQPLDLYAVKVAKQRIEEFYRSKGFQHTEVSLLEGDHPQHRRVVFLIDEDEKKRIWNVEIVGNHFESSRRLKTILKSKPGYLKYFFRGQVNENEIDADVDRLLAYYRRFGFFNARIGRELEYDKSRQWVTIRFIIDEGPRYAVRNVTFAGNEKYNSEQLYQLMGLKAGEQFSALKMQQDSNTLRDLYGSQGHILAKITADLRYLEEYGKLDLVYQIEEGAQYRVGRINVHVGGEYGFTKQNVVLNRISLRPGDVIDIRKIRNSERRLRSSGLFVNEQARGGPPRIEVKPPDPNSRAQFARQHRGGSGASTVRGQSPDTGEVVYVDVDFFGTIRR